MSDAVFRRLRALDREPTPDEILADLVELHAERPGVTEETLGAFRLPDGRTSYELLADAVPDDARAVLEVGCGNGSLAGALLARRPRITSLVGVDACAPEVERARARHAADPRAQFFAGDARALPFADASFDAVVSHHALYLVRPAVTVVAEVARVLRPGGTLAFVNWSLAAEAHEPFAAMMRAYSALTAGDAPHFRGWGDRPFFSAEGLAWLLVERGTGFVAPVAIEPVVLHAREPVADAVARLMRFFYSVDLQRPETREALRAAWTDALTPHAAPDGTVRHAFPMDLVTARRA